MSDIHTKLAKIAGDIGSINKTERNKEQGFNFRSIEQITEKARPLLSREGVSVAPKMLSIEHHEVTAKSGAKGYRAVVVMQYTFSVGDSTDTHASSIEVSMPGEAVDYGDKSTSKAVQMAYKYALTQVLQIGSGDDPDAHSVDVGNAEGYTPRPRSGGRRSPTPTPTSQAPESHTNGATGSLADVVAAYAKEQVAGFSRFSESEQADSYKRHSKAVLDGKPISLEEVDKVVKAMREEYQSRFPDALPV